VASKLRLNDGVDLIVEVALDELASAIEQAVQAGVWLRVNMGDEAVIVNPGQVLYMGEASEEEAAAIVNGRVRHVPEHVAG
jgi:hypothetical protein